MIPLIVALACFGGLLLSVLREGFLRVTGLALMLAAGAFSLASLVSVSAAIWAVPPLLASFTVARTRYPRLDFDPLIRRAAVIVLLVAAGLVGSLKLPLGEVPWPEFSAFWVLAALGLAWVIAPRDEAERALGATLLLAGGAGGLLVAFPDGVWSAGGAGLLASLPAASSRRRLAIRPVLTPIFLVLATLAIGLAASGVGMGRATAGDLTLALDGLAATAAAILLTAGALFQANAVGLVSGVLALVVTVPGVRWAALGVLVSAGLGAPVRRGWYALALFGLSPALSVLIGPPLNSHWQAGVLALAWLGFLSLPMSSPESRLLAVVATFLTISQVAVLPAVGVDRFQLAAVGGALLLLVFSAARHREPGGISVRDAVSLALLMTSVATTTVLGDLAAALLLIDIAVVRPGVERRWERDGVAVLGRLARAGWPPAITFGARVLALIAAVQSSVLFTVVTVVLLTLWPFTPLLDPQARAPLAGGRLGRLPALVSIAVSLGLGFAPSAVAAMLRLS
jgi:hypothetical protein